MRNTGFEIMPPSYIICNSQEVFFNKVRIKLNYSENFCETLILPINSYNKSVSQPKHGIPNLLFLMNECELEMNLPFAKGIPWKDAILRLNNYFIPKHKNNKRITNSPIIPITLTPSMCLPAYFIVRKLHFDGIAKEIEDGIRCLHANEGLIVLKQISLLKNRSVDFDEIESVLLSSISTDEIKANLFDGIEMSHAVLTLLEKQDDAFNSEFVVNWLYKIFPSLSNNKKEFEKYIIQILKKLKIENSDSAFIYWCFSTYFKDIDLNGREKFKNYIFSFKIKKEYIGLFEFINIDDINWFIDNISLDLNEENIEKLILVCAKTHSFEEKNSFFENIFKNDIIFIKGCNGVLLNYLLPYAEKYDNKNILQDIFNELKVPEKWKDAISINNKELIKLKWITLRNAFDIDKMELLQDYFLQADHIFYKWIKNKSVNDQVDLNMIKWYLNLQSTKVINYEKPSRLIFILDMLYRIKKSDELDEYINDFTQNFEDFSFENLLLTLYQKKKLSLCLNTLELIYFNCSNSVYLMDLFLRVLDKLDEPHLSSSILIPINEFNFKTALKLISKDDKLKVKDVIDSISSIARINISLLSLNELELLSKIVPYDYIFDTKEALFLCSEDIALYYSILQNLFEDKDVFEKLNLRFSHISLRAASLVCSDFPKFNFQFEIEDNNILHGLSNFPKINFKNEWSEIIYPSRDGSYTNLACSQPKNVCIYIISKDNEVSKYQITSMFGFIGYKDISIFFVDEDTILNPNFEAYIIYKPSISSVEYQYSFINQLSNLCQNRDIPILFNIPAVYMIYQVPNVWKDIFKGAPPNFIFQNKTMQSILWNEPSPTLLPCKYDLPIFDFEDGEDRIYNSKPFGSDVHQYFRAKITWKNERLFAGAILNTPISIYNFDLDSFNEQLNEIQKIAISKQKALCILSLLCESFSMIT